MDQRTSYVLAGLALIGVVAVWNSGRKSARKARKGVREVTRMTGNALRTLVTAAVICGVQWAAITWLDSAVVNGVVLAVPALLAGAAVARLLAVTEIVITTRGRRH
jgi:TRAP-type C4-dicarboxylate transport system permease large subunit